MSCSVTAKIYLGLTCQKRGEKEYGTFSFQNNEHQYNAIQGYRLQGYRDTGVQRYKATGLQTTGLQDYRLQDYRATGLQGYRDTGLQDYRATGLQDYRAGCPTLALLSQDTAPECLKILEGRGTCLQTPRVSMSPDPANDCFLWDYNIKHRIDLSRREQEGRPIRRIF